MTEKKINKILTEAAVTAGRLAYKATYNILADVEHSGYLTKLKIYYSLLYITKDSVRMLISFNDKKLGVIDADIEFGFSDIEYGDEMVRSHVALWGLRPNSIYEDYQKIIDFKFAIAAAFEKKFLKQLKVSC